MTAIDQYLRKAGDRMLRQPWGNDANQLAQELHAILRSVPSPQAGALQVNLGPVKFATTDAPDIAIPLIDFDALTPEGVLAAQETTQYGEDNQQTDNARIFRRRTVLVGRIVSRQAGNTYTVKVYPNGPSEDYELVSRVQEVQGRDVADDTWILVARIDTCRFVTTSITDGQTITQSRIDLIDRQHFFSEGNVPRPYAPWGSGALLADEPALPHILTFIVYVVAETPGVEVSNYFVSYNPMLWLPSDRSLSFSGFVMPTIGGYGPTLGTAALTFDPVAATMAMVLNGGSVGSNFSRSQDAYTWASSAAISGGIVPSGVGTLCWPANAYQTNDIYADSVNLHADVRTQWGSLGAGSSGYSAVYGAMFLKF